MATRTLNVQITGDSRSLDRALSGAGKSTGKFGAALDELKVLGPAALAAVGFAAVGVAKKFVDMASDVDESLTKNQVLFGKHAKSIDQWSRSTASSMGISRREALAATGQFGSLFETIGLADRPAAQMSQRFVKLAADLASFNNASPKETLEALRSGLSGEAEPMRRFGALLSETRVKTEAWTSGLVRQGEELTEQQKVQARYQLILKDTASAQGDFARTSGGLANQTRVLRARLDDIGAEIGRKLLPIVLSIARAFNRFLDQMREGRGVGGTFRRTMEALGRGIAETAKAISSAFSDIRAAMRATTSAVRSMVSISVSLLRGDWAKAWERAKSDVWDALRGDNRSVLKTAAGLINPIQNIMNRVGLAAVRGLLKGLQDLPEKLKRQIVDAIEKAARGIPGIFEDIGKDIGKSLIPGVGDGLGRMPGFVGGTGAGLQGADADLAPFARIGASMGLGVSSGMFGRENSVTSSGNQSYHATGDAIDLSGPPGAMLRFFRTMRGMFGSRLRELIYTPGGAGIKDGRPFTYGGQVARDHFDHVHVAYTGPFGDGLGRFSATSYGPPWDAMNGTGVTSTGVDLRPAKQVYGIAVDPSRLTLGKNYYVWPNPFGRRGPFKAFDIGGGIRGNEIDFYDWRGRASQLAWGSRSVTISDDPALNTSSGGRSQSSGSSGSSGGARQQFEDAQGMARRQSRRAVRTARRRRSGRVRGPGQVGPPKGRTPEEQLDFIDDLPTATDFLDRDVAMASLTAGTEDDLAAARAVQAYWQEQLRIAQGTADPRDDTAAAIALKSATDAVTALDKTIADEKAAREAHTAALEGVRTELRRQTDLAQQYASTSQAQMWKFLGDVMSGQFGRGIVGRSLSAGTGVEVAY